MKHILKNNSLFFEILFSIFFLSVVSLSSAIHDEKKPFLKEKSKSARNSTDVYFRAGQYEKAFREALKDTAGYNKRSRLISAANSAFMTGRHDTALIFYEKAFALSPATQSESAPAAFSFLKTGKREEAAEMLEIYFGNKDKSRYEENSEGLLLARAVKAQLRDRHADAASIYRKLLLKDPAAPVYYLSLAVNLLESKDTASAVNICRKAKNVFNDFFRIRYLLADIYTALGRTDEALNEIHYLGRYLSDDVISRKKALVYMKDGSYDSAAKYLEDSFGPETPAERMCLYAYTFYMRDMNDSAEEYYAAACSAGSPCGFSGLGAVYFEDGKYHKCAEILSEASRRGLKTDCDSFKKLIYSLAYTGKTAEAEKTAARNLCGKNGMTGIRGTLLHLRGEHEKAAGLLGNYILNNRDAVQELYFHSLSCAKSGKTDESLRSLLKLFKKRPEYAEGFMEISMALLEKKDSAGAETGLRKAVSADSANPAALNNLAYIIYSKNPDKKRLEEAEALIDRALKLQRDPALLDTAYLIYSALNRKQKAARIKKKMDRSGQ